MNIKIFTLNLVIGALICLFSLFGLPCPQLNLRQVGAVELTSLQNGVLKNFIIEKPSGTCRFAIGFKSTQKNEDRRFLRKGQQEISYGIYPSAAKQNQLGDESSGGAHLIRGEFFKSGAETYTFSVYFEVGDTNLSNEAGLYRDNVELRLNSEVNGTMELKSAVPLPILYHQLPYYNLALASPGSPNGSLRYLLDFNRLEKGKTLGFDILIQSNIPHIISFRSQNAGRLKNLHVPNQFVDYTLRVQGQEINLNKNETHFTPTDNSIEVLERYKAQVQIQEVSQSLSGSYRDFITIVVEAR